MLVILCFSVLQAQNAMLTNQSDILVQDTKPGSELGFSGKWVLGAGINMIEDSGQQEFVDFFTLKHKNWGNPFYISTEYLYNSQFSLGATFRFNKYQSGKTIQGLTIQEASEPQYFAIDFAAKLFLREILQRHDFTPYVTAGPGYRYVGSYQAENQSGNLVDAPKTQDITLNAGAGAYYWLGDCWGLNFDYMAKFALKVGANDTYKSNHMVTSFGVFYRFDTASK